MSNWVVPVLRVSVVVLLVALLMSQVFLLPAAGAALAQGDPGGVGFAAPLLLVAELVLVCIEFALVCTWVLLSMVERALIFADRSALAWVDRIVVAALVGTVLSGGAVWWSADRRPDLVPLSVGLGTAAVFGVGFTLLVVVMRGLLTQAAALRAELSEVI